MIEVRNVQIPAQVASSASSKGNVETESQKSGNVLPKQTDIPATEEQPKAEKPEAKKLEAELATVNDYVQSIQRNLQFSVDEELDRTVIKVVDGGSGELIRQIPEDVFLELARNLKDDGELQLVNALG